jgi:hypothetical protein
MVSMPREVFYTNMLRYKRKVSSPISRGEDVEDDNNRKDSYKAEIMQCYQLLIHDQVGHAQEQLSNIKNIRVSPPEKYSGEDDIEKFDTWLAGLLRWYQVYNVDTLAVSISMKIINI